MNILWEDEAWEQYLEWQKDKTILKRINLIIKDMKRNPFERLGQARTFKRKLSWLVEPKNNSRT